jgi:hypothetical protein
MLDILRNLLWQRAINFVFMRSSLLASVIVTELRATEASFSLGVTKAKYGISRLSVVEKGNVTERINPSHFFAYEENNSI